MSCLPCSKPRPLTTAQLLLHRPGHRCRPGSASRPNNRSIAGRQGCIRKRSRHDRNTLPPEQKVLGAKPTSQPTRGLHPGSPGYPFTPWPLVPCRLGLCSSGDVLPLLSYEPPVWDGTRVPGISGGVEQRRRSVSATGSAQVRGDGLLIRHLESTSSAVTVDCTAVDWPANRPDLHRTAPPA